MSFSLPPLANNDYMDKKVNAVVVHDSDVQDIIKMMKEDLNLEKLNDQNDVTQEIVLPTLEYEDNLSLNLNLNEEDKIITSSSSSNATTSKLNDSDQISTNRENTYEINMNSEEKIESVMSQDADLLLNDEDHEDEEDDDLNKELIEFIEKAKDFNANALDLSRKNINKIPKKLLELNQLQASH